MSALSALQGVGAVFYGRIFVTLPVPGAIPGLAEQIMIVTGSNSGLGLEATKHLSRLGVGRLIMAVRNTTKGEAARKEILELTKRPESSIEIWTLDMDSYESVKAFTKRVAELPRVDGVLANAGILTTKFGLSENFEKTLNVNVVSTFLLYLLLLPKMRESSRQTGNPCRYVIPNSALHYTASIAELSNKNKGVLKRLSDPNRADMPGRYSLSKLLVLYAVREFAARNSALADTDKIIINTPNPSFCKSNLANENQSSAGFRMGERLLARSTEEGSRALVHGMLAGPESNGQYINNCHMQRYSSFLNWTTTLQN